MSTSLPFLLFHLPEYRVTVGTRMLGMFCKSAGVSDSKPRSMVNHMSTYLYDVLERLIAFDTVSSHSDVPAMEHLAGHMERHRFKAMLHRTEIAGVPQANLVAWAGPPRPDGLIISGHLDTVPVEGQPGWDRDPLRMEVAGDRIYGRGTADMKGFLAQCVDAAGQLDRARLLRPLVFLFTS